MLSMKPKEINVEEATEQVKKGLSKLAEFKGHFFKELKAQGFTDEQALSIVVTTEIK